MLQIEQSELYGNFVSPSRDYAIYASAMEAAAMSKFNSISRYFSELKGGATVVDVGAGTGIVAEMIAQAFRAHVVAVDRSPVLLEYASRKNDINVVCDDATQLLNIADVSIDVIYHGTMGHEIYSEKGVEGLEQTLKAALRVLKPGGQEVWRDMLKPVMIGNVLMRVDADDGINLIDQSMTDGVLDYTKLSTRALFERFHQEFLGGSAFAYRLVTVGQTEYIELQAEFAQEFILRKDYRDSWRQEILEKYTYWTLEEAELVFRRVGFVCITVISDDCQYIREQRLRTVGLFLKTDDGLEEIEFPTHMIISARKPKI